MGEGFSEAGRLEAAAEDRDDQRQNETGNETDGSNHAAIGINGIHREVGWIENLEGVCVGASDVCNLRRWDAGTLFEGGNSGRDQLQLFTSAGRFGLALDIDIFVCKTRTSAWAARRHADPDVAAHFFDHVFDGLSSGKRLSRGSWIKLESDVRLRTFASMAWRPSIAAWRSERSP
jgi:hypothetical protein